MVHPTSRVTAAWWEAVLPDNAAIGFLDINVARTDGSTQRFNGVGWDLSPDAAREEGRFARVPWDVNQGDEVDVNYVMVPRGNR